MRNKFDSSPTCSKCVLVLFFRYNRFIPNHIPDALHKYEPRILWALLAQIGYRCRSRSFLVTQRCVPLFSQPRSEFESLNISRNSKLPLESCCLCLPCPAHESWSLAFHKLAPNLIYAPRFAIITRFGQKQRQRRRGGGSGESLKCSATERKSSNYDIISFPGGWPLNGGAA